MDVVGSEIGQKMRSAIKAKLTELGCYVDDELPDYVMVMVANKRTRTQMEEDLLLFLGDNTIAFVGWLHQVLRKLQEVTVPAPPKPTETRVKSESRSSSKDRRSKDKKDKTKKKHKMSDGSKKSKKKDKVKEHRKKAEKKIHKHKKKSKSREPDIIRTNIPPLLMNMEREAEPSITDAFAGQILKNHGDNLEPTRSELYHNPPETKRLILPIIDPAEITSQLEEVYPKANSSAESNAYPNTASASLHQVDINSAADPGGSGTQEHLKEINVIESKIHGLRQKLARHLDMSDDEDLLTIKTEAEELMNDYSEEIHQEINLAEQAKTLKQQIELAEANSSKKKSPSPTVRKSPEVASMATPEVQDVLPQIELNLPKRPIRERLGSRVINEDKSVINEDKSVINEDKSVINEDKSVINEDKSVINEDKCVTEKKTSESKEPVESRMDSSERFTPEKEKMSQSRATKPVEPARRTRLTSKEIFERSNKRISSEISVAVEGRSGPASVVRPRARQRPTSSLTSNLLLKAVADAHKSLLNIPPKVEPEEKPPVNQSNQLRRMDGQKIVVQVPPERGAGSDHHDNNLRVKIYNNNTDQNVRDVAEGVEYVPTPIKKRLSSYDPSSSGLWRATAPATATATVTSGDVDDECVVDAMDIHHSRDNKEKGPKFVVTLEGLNPNVFLAKKLKIEGIIEDEDEIGNKTIIEEDFKENVEKKRAIPEPDSDKSESSTNSAKKKRVSDTSEDSDTQVIISSQDSSQSMISMKQHKSNVVAEKRKSIEECSNGDDVEEKPPSKKTRTSPIVFDVQKKGKERVRKRTESTGSDKIATTTNTHKYDSLPALLPSMERKPLCRSFPQCRYGASCAFAHPACKFGASCTRRGCVYAHSHPAPAASQTPPAPFLASHVVPAANYKSVCVAAPAAMCKYFPSCSKPACHFYHPKPCRYGPACVNRLHCNFYHSDPTNKWTNL